MQYKAIFFDLDGTLLPLEQQTFTKAYFKHLAGVLAPYGIAPEVAINAVKTGLYKMQTNDGSATNEQVFWQAFGAVTGKDTTGPQQDCDAYYTGAFQTLQAYTAPNPGAKVAVELARKLAGKVVLATSPVFPLVAQAARLGWIGLTPEDFDRVTNYTNSTYSKPNPKYYLEICRTLDLAPGDCLMVGNDELEDMYAASAAGLHCILLTDHILPSAEHPWAGPRCTFAEFLDRLQKNQI